MKQVKKISNPIALRPAGTSKFVKISLWKEKLMYKKVTSSRYWPECTEKCSLRMRL